MKINRIIKLLILSDIFVITGFGLIDPIIAIYINNNLIGGSIFTAGLASTIFLVTKSIIQLPFARYIDKDGHKTDFGWLIVGTIAIAAVPFIYIFSTTIYHVYAAQVVQGVGSALAFPTWLSIWTHHLDRKHQSYEWSLYSTSVALGTAVSTAIGAAIAQFLGFTITFMFVGILSLLGCAILFHLKATHKKHR